MKAIRGATTVSNDSPEEIRAVVKELLEKILLINKLNENDILCILFSNTADIRTLYPAKAAREAGFVHPALYSSLEPEIEGSLPFCIRVLLFVETNGDIKHIYLNGAKVLRKDLSKFTIALDGPSGSGKSTIAKALSKEYDILYLDTGAMYRACALKALNEGINITDVKAVESVIQDINLRIEYLKGVQHTFLDEKDVSDDIRRPEISMAASQISALSCVRKKMVEMQRKIAESISCVLDGRDIGTAVLPNADFKFFITASSFIRAQRRYNELIAKGFPVDFDELKKEIELRDKNDSSRENSPLKMADDAILIDTSDMNISEVVDCIKRKIQEKV